MLYLIALERPLGNERHQARFYLGYCGEDRVLQRLEEHRAGKGAKMLRAANQRGIGYQIVMTWPGSTRKLERKLKNHKNHKRLVNR